jgi:hypothetical protein
MVDKLLGMTDVFRLVWGWAWQGCTHWTHWALVLEQAIADMDADLLAPAGP